MKKLSRVVLASVFGTLVFASVQARADDEFAPKRNEVN